MLFSNFLHQDFLFICTFEAIDIEAASLCKHAGRAKLADGASVLVDLPPSLPPDRVFTIFIEPHRHRIA